VRILVGLGILLAAVSQPSPEPPTLLTNLRACLDPGQPATAAALVLSEGHIEFVGAEEEAKRRSPGARVIELAGGVVYPGFIDSHGHLWELGELLETADLKGGCSEKECAERMKESARRQSGAGWVIGSGWDQNLWAGKALPDAQTLDAVLPARPALARRVDGHALWVNTAAMRAAGISRATPEVSGGRIVRRADGEPSGVFLDNAADLISAAQPPSSVEDLRRRFRLALLACAAAGLTAVGDASGDTPGYDERVLPVLTDMARAGDLPIRVYATFGGRDAELDSRLARGRVSEGLLTIRAVKFYMDGALGSRGAALLADYSDDPGNRGFFVTEPSRLQPLVEKCFAAGFQVWIHAIGDRANRAALDAIEQGLKSVRPTDPRPRIEHAQVVAGSDRPRFSALAAIASIQPSFATSDMRWAESRLSSARIGEAYAWRSLQAAGARLCGGSDFPWESHRPLLGIFAAVSREDVSGEPPGGWRSEEDLSRAAAISLYTRDAAYAMFDENHRGGIAPGFDADLTVLDRDLATCPIAEIPRAKVLLTMVGGRVVFSAR
jgi:predicted amidohydrolase YtcJ